ncbi:sigma-70 family RNA polymerase sigma factor [uncultured Algoriphagus sp.]|mgnify:CR=1 FL=1|uniref:RNA polymerase sigma factor n=1 Tax=uncultured Algoriphagus sp. TaxID=417365 RepID=UPI0030EC4189|tara:strand:+ start:7050 stop:7685 length:636 start_codon:yes stop_codon:yes gene_type:complete
MSNNPKIKPDSIFIPIKHLETIRIFERKTDGEIWNAFNRGDEMAFNFIYRTYIQDLYQYGGQFTSDSDVVKDCIQNLFIYLRKKRGELNEVTNIKGYLFRSIQREILRKLKNDLRPKGFDEEYLENSFQIEVSVETSMIRNEAAQEQKEKLQKGLNKLTSKQRKALLLFYEDELSYKEIASIMNFSEVKSARKLIYRALASLKEIIKPTSF